MTGVTDADFTRPEITMQIGVAQTVSMSHTDRRRGVRVGVAEPD